MSMPIPTPRATIKAHPPPFTALAPTSDSYWVNLNVGELLHEQSITPHDPVFDFDVSGRSFGLYQQWLHLVLIDCT